MMPSEDKSLHARPLITKSLFLAWLALCSALALTVASTFLQLGKLNLLINFGIATFKVGLIAWYYMQLNHENAVTRLFAALGLIWLAIFFSLVMADYFYR